MSWTSSHFRNQHLVRVVYVLEYTCLMYSAIGNPKGCQDQVGIKQISVFSDETFIYYAGNNMTILLTEIN